MCLAWHCDAWEPACRALLGAGFLWESFIAAQPVLEGDHPTLRRLVKAVTKVLPSVVDARIRVLRVKLLERAFLRWSRALYSPDPAQLPASVVVEMRAAISSRNPVQYRSAFRTLLRLWELAPILEDRVGLLARLHGSAPAWAEAIRGRVGTHESESVSGNAAAAWR